MGGNTHLMTRIALRSSQKSSQPVSVVEFVEGTDATLPDVVDQDVDRTLIP